MTKLHDLSGWNLTLTHANGRPHQRHWTELEGGEASCELFGPRRPSAGGRGPQPGVRPGDSGQLTAWTPVPGAGSWDQGASCRGLVPIPGPRGEETMFGLRTEASTWGLKGDRTTCNSGTPARGRRGPQPLACAGPSPSGRSLGLTFRVRHRPGEATRTPCWLLPSLGEGHAGVAHREARAAQSLTEQVPGPSHISASALAPTERWGSLSQRLVTFQSVVRTRILAFQS